MNLVLDDVKEVVRGKHLPLLLAIHQLSLIYRRIRLRNNPLSRPHRRQRDAPGPHLPTRRERGDREPVLAAGRGSRCRGGVKALFLGKLCLKKKARKMKQ